MLTKSLHTITAATNVARHLLNCHKRGEYRIAGPISLAYDALVILGHQTSISDCTDDPTVQRIVAACDKLLANRTKAAA